MVGLGVGCVCVCVGVYISCALALRAAARGSMCVRCVRCSDAKRSARIQMLLPLHDQNNRELVWYMSVHKCTCLEDLLFDIHGCCCCCVRYVFVLCATLLLRATP